MLKSTLAVGLLLAAAGCAQDKILASPATIDPCQLQIPPVGEIRIAYLEIHPDPHGTYARLPNCRDRIFDVGFAESDLSVDRNAELLTFIEVGNLLGSRKAILDVKARFQPNQDPDRYPGKFVILEILGYRLFDAGGNEIARHQY